MRWTSVTAVIVLICLVGSADAAAKKGRKPKPSVQESSKPTSIVVEAPKQVPPGTAMAGTLPTQQRENQGSRKAGDRMTLTIKGVEYPFRWCPEGTFMMGSPENEKGRKQEENPSHVVTLTRGFWMLETEVTQEMWESVQGNNPSHFRDSKRLPVDSVSWDVCQEYIQKLNSIGVTPLGYKFSLPTEAQWEYACRAGSTTSFCFGEYSRSLLEQYAWYSGCWDRPEVSAIGRGKSGQTHPVGTKRPNAWGLYDMHGNVSEWCSDWHSNYSGGAATDPTGPSLGSKRVNRGGCWLSNAVACRSAFRSHKFASSDGDDGRGFRLALVRVDSYPELAPSLQLVQESKVPQPDPDAIAKAQQLASESYRVKIDRAKKSVDKAKLAVEFMDAATKIADDEASKFVLLTMARDFAIDAKARKTAINATIAIADRYQPATGDPNNAKDQFEKAQQLWRKVEEVGKNTSGSLDRDKEKLRLQVQAVEWYARAMPGSTGLTKQICERKIAEVVEEAVSSDKQLDAKPDKSSTLSSKMTASDGKPFRSPGKSSNLPTGCVLYFAFEKGDYFQMDGQTWIWDRSGNKNHGQVIGNVQPAKGISPRGSGGFSAEFDGRSGYIQVNDSPLLDLPIFTLAAWVKETKRGKGGSPIINKKDDGLIRNGAKGYSLGLNNDGIPDSLIRGSYTIVNKYAVPVIGERAIAVGTWVHLAVMFDGYNRLTLYVDGNLVSTKKDKNPMVRSSGDLLIGSSNPRTTKTVFCGMIDEVMVINRALSPQEILRLASRKPSQP